MARRPSQAFDTLVFSASLASWLASSSVRLTVNLFFDGVTVSLPAALCSTLHQPLHVPDSFVKRHTLRSSATSRKYCSTCGELLNPPCEQLTKVRPRSERAAVKTMANLMASMGTSQIFVYKYMLLHPSVSATARSAASINPSPRPRPLRSLP